MSVSEEGKFPTSDDQIQKVFTFVLGNDREKSIATVEIRLDEQTRTFAEDRKLWGRWTPNLVNYIVCTKHTDTKLNNTIILGLDNPDYDNTSDCQY
jgi:hypothetical protein